MYTKVSIPKNSDGAGCPTAKKSNVIVIDVDDIKTFPTREIGSPVYTADIELNEGATAVAIYGTPATIIASEEYSGDPDAKGVAQGLAFEHPGDSRAIRGFTEAFLNKGVVIIVQECDGTTGTAKVYGTDCNPLFLTPERTDSTEANKRNLAFAQAMPGQLLAADYEGALPALADNASSSSSSTATETA